MKFILIILIVLLLLGLFMIAPRMFGRAQRSPFLGVHYAHRGLFDNRSEAPENSMAAFSKAVESGYGIELDVQLSKDGIPVVFHDTSLKRMCGIDGKVWEYTLEELRQMKLADSQESIPTFQEALMLIDGRVPLIVEYKFDSPSLKICEIGNELLGNYAGAYCIESFYPPALLWYRIHRPDVMRGQLCEEYWKENEQMRGKLLYLWLAYLGSNFLTRPDFIAYNHVYERNLSRRLCRRLGALSVAYTIRSREEYEKVKDQFDLFIFDGFLMKE
ncbi:MAG: glycerophosphodiester phosphodiesterase family protein [Lachnospiraceae bacterium]